jgi:hypothetical protein
VKNPADVYDYMSYCGFQSKGNVWTSPWTYEHIYAQTQSGAAAGLKSPALLTSQTYFMASGLVYADDTAILDPGWVVTSSATPVNPPPGSQYCLEAQDVSGVPLTSYCFDLSFMNYETLEPSTVDGFSLMLPYPSGTDRIVLKKGTSELAVQPVTEHSPVVTVTSPNGGENWPATGAETITWTASDGDNNSLTYQVFYSPDGTNWIPLGGETTTTQITVNTAELAGSDAAYIRVMASDGVNTGSDESDGAFSVGRKVPQVNIITPEGSMTIFPDTPLWLQGYAYDLEDGMLGQGSLQWSSDRDGLLGKGSEALITLSPGLHHLTLSAQDSDGNTAYASISVFVGPKIYLPVIAVSH